MVVSCAATELVRHSRTLFWNSNKSLRVCCAVSKRYKGDYQPYWYAFRPNWDRFLSEGKDSYFVLSCMDREEAYALNRTHGQVGARAAIASKSSVYRFFAVYHPSTRACCTISTRTCLVSAGLLTSRKNATRAPRTLSCVFTRI